MHCSQPGIITRWADGAVVSLTQPIARARHIGMGARWLRRVLSSGQASGGRACGSGLVVQQGGLATCCACCVLCLVLSLDVPVLGVRRERRDGLLFLLAPTAPSALRRLWAGSGRLWQAGWHRRPFEAAGDAPRAREAWRAVGLPDGNPRTLGGQLAASRRGAADGWLHVHRAG
jgi:hypothetical protein